MTRPTLVMSRGRAVSRALLIAALAGLAGLGAGCGSGARRPIDPEPRDAGEGDAPDAPIVDSDLDTDGLDSADPSLCGNNVIDVAEECDDGNRIDGDGCDWLCRRGDGGCYRSR